jgi:hypothetical protein
MQNSSISKKLHILTRHFFDRFFDSELFATPHSDMHLLFVQILALLILPGALETLSSISKYAHLAWLPIANRDQAVLIDTHSFLAFSMILTGFITVFEWDALFPDDKDICILTPLPIKPRTLFFAKVISLSLFVAFVNAAINGFSTLFFSVIVLSASPKPGSAGWCIPSYQGITYTACHGIVLLLSSIFVFAVLISFRAFLHILLPIKLTRSTFRFAQLALILLLFCAFLTPIQPDRMLAEKNTLIYWLPTFWFLGLHEWMIGHCGNAINALAEYACIALLASFFVSILSYMISYRLSMQKGFQSSGISSHHRFGLSQVSAWILHKTILRRSTERAIFHFISQTIFRQREPLLYCGSFVMAGIAIIYTIWRGLKGQAHPYYDIRLSFPLILSFYILVGLRFAISVPADLNANWAFKIINKGTLERSFKGIRIFMFCAANIPLVFLFAPYYLTIMNYRFVLMHIIFSAMLSGILINLLLVRFDKLPFACTYLPGKANIKALWFPYLLCFGLYSFGTTALEQILLQNIKAYIAFIFFAAVVIVALDRSAALFLKRICSIRFEEESGNETTVLIIEG